MCATVDAREDLRGRRPDAATLSLALFIFAAIAFLLTGVLFESRLDTLSTTAQRWLGFATLVLPPAAGAAFAAAAFAARKRRALAAACFVLNALFAAFFALVLSFAG